MHDNLPHNAAVRNVALWLYGGSASAFLQDANSIIMSTPDLLRVVSHLMQTFPDLQRITSYGRSRNAAKKSSEEFTQIREAGLSRIHIGLESGCDEVLDQVQKGCTADHHIKGGRAVVEAGIELSEYVMPGLGGRRWSGSHVRETARVLNEIDPDFIRIRSFQAYEAMPMWQQIEHGGFELLREDEVVEEIGALIERLECHSVVKSDHMMNILMEVEGKLPEDKAEDAGPDSRVCVPSRAGEARLHGGEAIGLVSEPGRPPGGRQARQGRPGPAALPVGGP